VPITEPLADGYAIALEEARRALDEQERAVAQLSTRAGLLISAAAVVTSLLGGPVLARDAIDAAAWIAIAAFVGVAVAGLAILSPRRQWEFALHPALLIGDYVERTLPEPAALKRELALNMGAQHHP
jgi:cytochrome bd-type quinol oxidase subunit 2